MVGTAGANSRDKFNKPDTPTYKPGPGLPLKIIAEVKPIYVRLTEDELLERGLDGKTQNQNGSVNEMIRECLPKGVYVGQDTLFLCANDAVLHFNNGSKVLSLASTVLKQWPKQTSYKFQRQNTKQKAITN